MLRFQFKVNRTNWLRWYSGQSQRIFSHKRLLLQTFFICFPYSCILIKIHEFLIKHIKINVTKNILLICIYSFKMYFLLFLCYLFYLYCLHKRFFKLEQVLHLRQGFVGSLWKEKIFEKLYWTLFKQF